MTTKKAALLDVDGTLIDSNDAHAHAWVDTLAAFGHQVPFRRVRQLIGKGADKLLPETIGIEKDSPAGKEISERRAAHFKERYLPELEAFPAARQLLEALKAQGLKLVVATSAGKEELADLLNVAKLGDLIDRVTMSSDAKDSKPDADIVLAALDQAGCAPDEAVMLGDTPYDVEAARKAGVLTVALRCGGWRESDLADAVAIYDDALDLLKNLSSSPFAENDTVVPEERLDRCLQLVAGQRAVESAKARLVEANLRLVLIVARKYADRGLLLVDLVQEGCLGLLKAVDRFDPRRGVKFSTYATWWIRQSLHRALSDQGRTIRIPAHVIEAQQRVSRSRGRFARLQGRAPSLEELAVELDLPAHQVSAVLDLPQQPLSIDAPLNASASANVADLLVDTNASVADNVSELHLRAHVEKLLRKLPPRDRHILRLRFGINAEDHTLDEVGAIFDLSRERIRQIEITALKRLRAPSESLELQTYLAS